VVKNMGTYETFIVKCPICNEVLSFQTKLFECELNVIHIGDHRLNPVTNASDNYVIISKECCYECNNIPAFVFHKGVFTEVISALEHKQAMDGSYTLILEGSFGAYSHEVLRGEKEYTSRW
jgi:hypothetical protein